MSDNERLRELAKELPWDRPDPARRDAARSALLAAANQSTDPLPGTARRRYLTITAAFSAGALAAAAVAILVVRTRPVTSSSATSSSSTILTVHPARITALPSARIDHSVVTTATGIDETVRVHDGTLRLAVAPLRTGDHLRVSTRDAQVEGAGDYEVTVTADTLTAVSVRTGSAQIQVAGQQAIFLAAGQSWRGSVVTADLSSNPTAPSTDTTTGRAPDNTPSSAGRTPDSTSSSAGRTSDSTSSSAGRTPDNASSSAARTPDNASSSAARTPDKTTPSGDRTPDKTPDRTPDAGGHEVVVDVGAGSGVGAAQNQPGKRERAATPTELHFRIGWQLLKAGKAKEAAVELAAAADANPDDPLAGDARYFQAVALVRAGQKIEAERVLVAFLDHAPRSMRRGRAAVLLGGLLNERGSVESARAWYKAAVDDPDREIASAARAGLDSLPPNR